MERIGTKERPDWPAKLESVGIPYHSGGQEPETGAAGGLWWAEDAYWALSSAEVDALDDATVELHARCLDAVDHIVTREPDLLRTTFGMPEWFADYVRRSWMRRDPYLMGRMDLAFDDRSGAIKLLEYNADTPTMAIETGVAQWFWLLDTHPGLDQFNSLHEKLLERFKGIASLTGGQRMHFAAFEESREEWNHATYFRDLAEQAGIPTVGIDIPLIGWDGSRFVGEQGETIRFLHKLYPWEWAVTDEFGRHLAADSCGLVEPPWKAILSDKAVLPILWRLFPNHPNLLEARHGRLPASTGGAWVEKPCLGREGANVRMTRDGSVLAETPGTYADADARFIHQAMAVLPEKDGWQGLIGSWVVGDESGGIIFRESRGSIVRDNARVVPHLFR